MVTVGRGLAAGSVLLVATLAGLAATVGLTAAGWLVGLACGAVTTTAVARSHPVALGPADLVTVTRLALACAVAALVADSVAGGSVTALLVGLSAVALALDAVDGRVARRTGTASGFGARFDGEADAFLLLVLSAYAAGTVAPWALAIGVLRYVFAAAGVVLPWLRAELPFRYWRKVVTAVQGVVLLLAAADVTPRWATYAALLVALGLLAESFGRDVLWLWHRRRVAWEEALERARRAAYPRGEFVGQESFMRASEIRDLAARAGIGAGTTVLDLCCGVAGPGRLVASELGCTYVGVDASADAIAVARGRAEGLPCRFEVGRVPPVPAGPVEVVLLLETMLAFEDKDPLLRGVAAALVEGGRFAFTVEEGMPLSAAERARMPAADTVWPVPLRQLVAGLARAGLRVGDVVDLTASHREVVEALVGAFEADRPAIESRLGRPAVADLLASHRLWSEWLGSQRIRKLAVVAQRTDAKVEPAGARARTPS